MGLAASQARLLALTARQSDIEYRGQTLNNRRLQLTYAMETIANEYSDKMADRKLFMNIDVAGKSTSVDFNAVNLNGIGFTLAGSDGVGLNEVYSKKTVNGQQVNDKFLGYGADADHILSDEEIEMRLRGGTAHIVDKASKSADGTYPLNFDWRSDSSSRFTDKYDTDNDEAAAAKYEADSAKVQGEDKRLEMELKQLDTQHKAIETEVEAVKKVIDKNVQSSFKTFG